MFHKLATNTTSELNLHQNIDTMSHNRKDMRTTAPSPVMGECPHPHQQQLFRHQQQLQNPYHPHHDLNNKYRGLATSATSQNPTHHHINSSAASSSQSHLIPSQVHGAASVSQWQKELWQKMSFRDDDSGYNDDSDSEGSTGTSQRSLTPVVGREDCQLEEFCGQPKWTSSSNDAKQDFPSQQPSSNYHSLQSQHSELLLSQSPTNSDCSDNDWLARDLGITAGTDEKQAFASAYDSLKNPSSQNNWTPAVKAGPPRQLSPRDMTRDVIPPPPPPPFTLLSGQDNLHDALIKIGQLSAGSNLVAPGKQHQTSIQQDPSLTKNINGLINECQEAEDFLWTLVFNVIQDELKFKQSPFFKNCNASNGLGPMPSLGPMAPPSGLLPMPPPPPPPGLAPFMHQIQNGQRKMYRNESPQMRQPYGPGPKQQETPMQYRGNWFGEMQ